MSFVKYLLIVLLTGVSVSFGQSAGRVELGQLVTGADVSFVSGQGQWGLEIGNGPSPSIVQPKPVRLEVFESEDDISQIDR